MRCFKLDITSCPTVISDASPEVLSRAHLNISVASQEQVLVNAIISWRTPFLSSLREHDYHVNHMWIQYLAISYVNNICRINAFPQYVSYKKKTRTAGSPNSQAQNKMFRQLTLAHSTTPPKTHTMWRFCFNIRHKKCKSTKINPTLPKNQEIEAVNAVFKLIGLSSLKYL